MSNKEEFKGDTIWGDFKATALGGILIGLGSLLFLLLKITLVGLLLYGILKATFCWLRRLLFKTPLPDFEEFPRSWYGIALFFWLFVVWVWYCSMNGGCYSVLNIDPYSPK